MSEENGNYFSDSYNNNRSLAYFGTASYSYRSRYIINGTIRYEGSNKLGKSSQSRWLPTWNVSGAWNADAEEWFQNPVLATAKLRLSYSLTADGGPRQRVQRTAIYVPRAPGVQEGDSRELGIELYDLANSELTYEKKHELDIGVDLGFLNNRINLSFDWYKRDNFRPYRLCVHSGVGGINTKLANNANLASHGVEFTLTTHNIQGRDLSWTTDWTFSYAKNKITNLQSRSRVIDLIQGSGYAIEGYPVRAIFSIPFVGLSETGLPVIINEKGEKTSDNINMQDFENLGFLKYEGRSEPDHYRWFRQPSPLEELRSQCVPDLRVWQQDPSRSGICRFLQRPVVDAA